MFKKKIATMVVIGLSVVSLYLSLPVSAEGNYTDTDYYLRFENGKSVYTEGRKKEDTTSSYIKCTYCSYGYYYSAAVYGMYGEPRYGRFDCSGGHSYAITQGGSCKLVNYVKERNYTHACIQCTPVSSVNSFDTYGVWSPDSI